MFKGFTQERLAQIMAIGSAPPKYNRALIFSFKFEDGQPVVSHVRTFKGVKPDDVRVVITSGIAIVPLDMPPDVAWLQLVKKLGAFAVELECEGGDAPGYSPIRVSQDAVKRKLKNKLQFTARVASHLVDRLESLIEGPEGSRAAVIDYAIQRLTDDLYAQAQGIGPGVLIGIQMLSQDEMHEFPVRVEQAVFDRLRRVATGTNSALVERAILHMIYEAAAASSPIEIGWLPAIALESRDAAARADAVAEKVALAASARNFLATEGA